MKNIGKSISFLTLLSTVLFAEPSVYGSNGDFYSSSNNKKSIASLERKISTQNERIDGLMSIVEGLSATVNQLQSNSSSSKNVNENNNDRKLFIELGEMIDKINADYVSKTELQRTLKSKGYDGSTLAQSKAKTQRTNSSVSVKGKSTSVLYREGVSLFAKKRYDESKKRFILTDEKGYKAAASNYYLGEISYYTKKYEDAIFYFKKSAGLDDQTSYIDTLLLHTAVSLERNGEKGQARDFYQNIIANYEGKRSAEIAKEKLKKL